MFNLCKVKCFSERTRKSKPCSPGGSDGCSESGMRDVNDHISVAFSQGMPCHYFYDFFCDVDSLRFFYSAFLGWSDFLLSYSTSCGGSAAEIGF